MEHPGIVPVYGMGTYADGRPFYAMRFIRGDSLKEGIEKFFAEHRKTGFPARPTPQIPARAYESFEFRKLLQRFIDVCNAIAYAHARGVLHRDLKPGNIMLGKYGETLVVDWGLAKATGQVASGPTGPDSVETSQPPLAPSPDSNSAETIMGSALGTPAYMSPEQAAGRIDLFTPATDIYSLGATLYHLLTGRPPHTINEDGRLLQRIQAGEYPAPRDANPNMPKPLAAICEKAMAHRPESRYQSALDLAADVEHWLADDPVSAHQDSLITKLQRWSRRHRTFVTSAAALLVTALVALAIGYVVLKLEQGKTLAEKGKVNDALTASQRQLAANYFQHGLAEYDAGRYRNSYLDLYRAAELTPTGDARSHAYRDVLLDRLFGGGRTWNLPLTHHYPMYFASFSPNGSQIITQSYDGVQLWNRDGSLSNHFFDHDGFYSPEFSSDGKRLLVGGEQALRVWDLTSGSYVAQPIKHSSLIRSASFSPDGKLIVSHCQDGIRIWDAKSGNFRRKLEFGEFEWGDFGFSPNGSRLLLERSNMKEITLWDPQTGKLIGESIPCDFSRFSPDSSRLLTCKWEGSAQLYEAENGRPVSNPLTHKEGIQQGFHTCCFSHDSQMIAVATGRQVIVWNVKGMMPSAKTLDYGEQVTFVTFSPDDSQVLAISGEDLHLSDLKDELIPTAPGNETPFMDSGTTQILARRESRVSSACYSPDGQYVLTFGPDSAARLWMSADGGLIGEPLRLDEYYSKRTPAFSADGSHYLTVHDGVVRSWVVPPPPAFLAHPLPEQTDDGSVYSATFDSTEQRLITTSVHSAQLWDAHKLTPVGNPMPFFREGIEFRALFSPSGSHVLTYEFSIQSPASEERKVNLWDAETGSLIGSLLHPDSVKSATFSPNGALAATICHDNVRLWNVADGTPAGNPLLHEDIVIEAAFNPSSSRLITACRDKKARIWNVADGVQIGDALDHPEQVVSANYSPDGSRILTRSRKGWQFGHMQGTKVRFPTGEARLWDARTGQLLGTPIQGADFGIFSPDGTRLLTLSDDGTARLWHSHTGALIGPPMLGYGNFAIAVFSADSQRFVTISGYRGLGPERVARLWDGQTGARIGEPLRHSGDVCAAEFSPDGSFIVTASFDGTARVWLAATGTLIGEPLRHIADVNSVKFSRSGRQILTGSSDGSAGVWELDQSYLRFANDPQAVRLLTEVATRFDLRTDQQELRLSEEDWAARWNELTSHQLWRDHVTGADRRREKHHAVQAAAAERNESWFAAAWHLERLVKKEPENAALRERWETAKQKVGEQNATLDAAWRAYANKANEN